MAGTDCGLVWRQTRPRYPRSGIDAEYNDLLARYTPPAEAIFNVAILLIAQPQRLSVENLGPKELLDWQVIYRGASFTGALHEDWIRRTLELRKEYRGRARLSAHQRQPRTPEAWQSRTRSSSQCSLNSPRPTGVDSR